jgi:hypothetical protein
LNAFYNELGVTPGVALVPEPATYLLFGTAITMIGLPRRRVKQDDLFPYFTRALRKG